MSIVSDFAKGAFAKAKDAIGGEDLSIDGGATVSAVLAEVTTDRDYEGGGFADEGTRLRAVVSLTDWSAEYAAAAETYLGKTATARGLTFTVESIETGVVFVQVELVGGERAR